jgi:small subunit ribosomal protein S20
LANENEGTKKKLVKGRHASAIKRARQTIKRNARNSARRSRVATFEKKVVVALKSKNLSEAKKSLVVLMKEMDKAAQKGVIHFKRAARRIGRLSKAIVQAELSK